MNERRMSLSTIDSRNTQPFIYINDIFDDLSLENNRLTHQLLYANKCMNVLLKLRIQLQYILSEYKSYISNDNIEQINALETEYNDCLKQTTQNHSNDCDNNNINYNSKKSYNCLSLEQKCELISNVSEKRCTNADISKQFRISLATVNYIYKHKRKYLTQYRNKYNNAYKCNDSRNVANSDQNICNDSRNQSMFEEKQSNNSITDCNDLVNQQNKMKNELSSRKYKRVKKRLTCDWIGCGFSVCDRNKLLEHVNATHTGVRPYKCQIPECGKQFARRFCLNVHLKSHSKLKLFECDICGTKLKSKLTLKFHKMIHRNEKPYVCDFAECGYKALTAYILENHRRRMHTNEKPFKCDFRDCDWRFSTKNGLRSHQITHSDHKPYACEWPSCEERFKRLILLKNHRSIHTGDRLRCDYQQCEFECSQSRQLRMHKMRRHFEKKVICSWPGCGHTFIDTYRMKVHLTRHTGIKQYVCVWPNCDKSFATNSRLDAHMAIHLGDKSHKCLWPACEKSFVDAGNMKKHFRIHLKTNQLSI